MAWAKIDDRFFSHPKVRRAGKDAVMLYLAALTYANEHLTEGFIPEESLPLIAFYAFIDDPKQNASKLLEVGLWEYCSKGYMIHDYLEYNPTREQVEETKKARAEAGSRGGRAKAARKVPETQPEASKTLAKPKQNSSKSLAISPPLPSPLTPSKDGGEQPENPKPYPVAQVMAEVCHMNFEANKGRLLKEAKLLVSASPPPTGDLIRTNYGAGGWWYREDWRGKKGEVPNPATVRETWGQFPLNGNGKTHEPEKVLVNLPGVGVVEAHT